MKKNICFIANYTKTFLFHEVAQQLIKQDVRVFWIVVNKKLLDFLLEHYPQEKILYISKHNINLDNDFVGEFKLNELIYGDRVLRHDLESSYRYLKNIQLPIYHFIQRNNILKIFGEITWAHELLIHRICQQKKELQCQYLNPHSIRIPNGRFAFFEDERQSIIHISNKKNSINISNDRKVISVEKPDYLALNDRILANSRSFVNRLKKIKFFITGENKDPFDPTILNKRLSVLRMRAKEEINKELYRFVKKHEFDKFINKKILFLALHKQPEASIDVIGRYYEDQFLNIINLWRNLPNDWVLLVKEHTNAIGDRSLFFYSKVAALKNVYIINENNDSHKIISKSSLVATVSGTVAYEAALLGIPSITFAPTFFNRLSTCKHIQVNDFINSTSINDFILLKDEPLDKKFHNWLLNNSFEGIISDYLSDNRCMSSDNIYKLANAFMKVIINEEI